MDANALDLNNYRVKQVPRFAQNGQIKMDWRVTFMLGEHGPFVIDYPDKMPEHTKLQADIGAIAQTIRAGASVQV